MKRAGQCVEVVYEIMHSPSYQVPVLYFYFADPAVGNGQGIEAVYRYVVPSQHHQSLQSLGALGGIGPVVSAYNLCKVDGNVDSYCTEPPSHGCAVLLAASVSDCRSYG